MAEQPMTSSPQVVQTDSADKSENPDAPMLDESPASFWTPIILPKSPSLRINSPVLRALAAMPPIEPKTGSPVSWIPREIIEQILIAADPNTFASLSLLNRTWYGVAQQSSIYGLQLSRCLSFVASNKSFDVSTLTDDDLPRLRRLFALEVKRNLYDAYLRPSTTEIRLISNTISSTSAPGGEGLQFSPSPRGHHILAYNSSRVYLVDLRSEEPAIKREFSVLRRPVSICVNDEGTVLAVLSVESQVDLYDLTKKPPKRTQTLILDHKPHTIVISPCGTVLASAYQGGIEVSSLRSDALATDRRAVKTDTVDSLAFSFDGTQLLGTTLGSTSPSTVIITAPYYDPGTTADNNSSLWTTSILFPNTSRDCSHAVLIQHTSKEEAGHTFTYDRNFETFRAVSIDDLRNGTTYWTGPLPCHVPNSNAKLSPCTLPAATYHGDLVSAGFMGKDVWLYGVPENLDAIPKFKAENVNEEGSRNSANLGRKNSSVSNRSSPGPAARVPQWQKLFAQNPNTFVQGYKVAELKGAANVKFVEGYGGKDRIKERLVIAAKGVTVDLEEDAINFVDGGRITVLDFDYRLRDGINRSIEIEVGTQKAEMLEEVQRNIEDEVAIVRRRTVAQKTKGARSSLLRAATTGTNSSNPMPAIPPLPLPENELDATSPINDDDDPLIPRRMNMAPGSSSKSAARTIVESPLEETSPWETFDAPYSQQSPRSHNTLRRAATAAAANSRLRPTAPNVEYRRADGRQEHPHESDADNWEPPPPPYQAEDPGAIPNFLRQPAVAPLPERPQTSAGANTPIGLSMIQESMTPTTLTSSPSRRSMMSSVLSLVSSSSPQRSMTVMVTPGYDNPRAAIAHRLSQWSMHGHSRTLSDTLPNTTANISTEAELVIGQVPTTISTERIVLENTCMSEPQTAGLQTATTNTTADNNTFIEQADDIYDASPIASPALESSQSLPKPPATAGSQLSDVGSRSVSMPQRSTNSAVDSLAVTHSSTFSPGGGDDYDPPAVWMSPGDNMESTPPTRRRPQPSSTWPRNIDNDSLQTSPQSTRSSERPMTSGSGIPLNIDTRRLSINQAPISQHPFSTTEPLRSQSTLLSPPSLNSHSHRLMGISFSASSTPVHFGTETLPLMISTPTCVIAASDPTPRPNNRPEIPILAPVARRPPIAGGWLTHPTVESLENLINPRPGHNPQASLSVPILPLFPPLEEEGSTTPISAMQRLQLPAWLGVGGSKLKHTHSASIRRSRSHTSRASQSAKKNMQDARNKSGKKVWAASTTGGRRRKKGGYVDAMSTSAWTDVSRGGLEGFDKKEKCVLM